jgi:cytochrome oxidase Cu insertion factor (SCO1/SenC/PrrC family)
MVRAPVDVGSWRQRLIASPGYAFRAVAASAAIGVVLVGGIPMAVAAASPSADPILATAVDGTPNAVDFPAPAFALVDQLDRPVSLADLRGKTIALTFLDPVCVSDCPVIAQEFSQADRMLGALSKKVEFVAIDANPLYTAPDYLLAFDHQENLSQISNWAYLTGRLPQLESIWNNYGILIGYSPGGAMIAHGELASVISPTGQVRYSLDSDPGASTSATKSSFAVTLADAITRTVNGS